ncbi:hypothetical protein MHU86_15662 [Fragilaria crotonensis]|nr:hypothetical protein MHU86_15662 [Fragilaria crotonensis]
MTSYLTWKQLQGQQSANDCLETLRGWADDTILEYHGGTVAKALDPVPEKDDTETQGPLTNVMQSHVIAPCWPSLSCAVPTPYDTEFSKDSSTSETAYTMVSTVAWQMKMFSRRKVCAAIAACDLYRKIGRGPSEEAEFQHILRQNLIRNSR